MADASAPRSGPFSRLYGPWVDRLAEAEAGRLQTLVLLCLCERLEFDGHGNASAWYPRAEMAERLGAPESAVSKAVTGLIKKRLLGVKRAGHKGRATIYNVFPGAPWPLQRCHGKGYQSTQRYPQNVFVGTPLRDTPKTYGGGGLTPASPHEGRPKSILEQRLEDAANGVGMKGGDW